MFIREKRINGSSYYYLCKTYREDGKVRQKVIEYIGNEDKLKAYQEENA